MARMKKLFWVLPIFLLCTVLGATAGEDGTGPGVTEANKVKYDGTAPDSNKISSNIRAVIEKIKARGITKQNARELGASVLSNPLVRVNDEASIQAYIRVHTFANEERAQLEAYEVDIEIVNEQLGMIQGWIPFDKIYEVAQLPFVQRITPPSYATPRVGTD
jgi:hypothetical protein